LQRFIPKELMAKLDSARRSGEMVGERRVVTALFCDVKGSTAAAEHLDPEDWSEIMNGAFERMIKPVYQFEGTVARLMGDAILAFFGAPIAHEDDPQRAVLAGLEIAASIKPYCAEIKRRSGIDFDVRVGINTGLVVVGAVGSDLRMEYSALGDAINLAARMEQTARPGTVQVAHDTYKLVKGQFDFEELGGIEVKGKSEPVPAYRALERKALAGHSRGIEGLQAALVGRDPELAALRAVVSDLKQGVGRIVCVVGEAGLGKSRLVAELGGDAAPASLHWYETASLSYESNQPYALFHRLIRRVTGIAYNDSPPVVQEKLKPLVDSVGEERRPQAAQAFAALFGLEREGGGLPLEGEAFKRELFEAMRGWWRGRFANRPTVLVFDDMHWSDAASVELLLHLLPLTEEIPLVLLCAFRPDRQAPAWRVKTVADADCHHRYTELALRPLSEAESSQLVSLLLSNATLPDRLRANILEKSGGNPFFVEEVVRTLIDSGAVISEERGVDGASRLCWVATSEGADFAIPDNLQSLLATRIDRLEEDTRQILQLASVIGRSFFHRVLTAMASDGAEVHTELDRHLGALIRMEMIQEAARLPEVEYKFSNPLMQEATYQTILLKRRREFHRRVGEAMETLFADRLAELAPRLGYHFAEAQDYERASKYLTMAGDAACRLYAHKEAIVSYDRALAMTLGLGDGSAQLAYLFARKGRALELNSQFAEALANYERMEALAKERGDRPLELSALILQGTIRSNLNELLDRDIAKALCERALHLAQELGDEATEAKIQWNLLNAYRNSDSPGLAVAAGERSLALSRKLNLREQQAYAANDLAYPYLFTGRIDLSGAVLQEALALWRELDNQPMLTDSLSTSALLRAYIGDFDGAIAFSDEAFQISESIHNLWGMSYSRYIIGEVHWARGDPARAIETMEGSIHHGRQAGFVVVLAWTQAQLAVVYGLLGRPDLGRELAVSALAQAEKYMPNFRSLTSGAVARLHLLMGDVDAAAATLHRGLVGVAPFLQDFFSPFGAGMQSRLALARGDFESAVQFAAHFRIVTDQLGVRQYAPEANHLYAQTLMASGQSDAAMEALRVGRSEAQAMGARWWLWQILADLGRAEAERGSAAEAAALHGQAREIVEYIADHSPAELRESFLSLPNVKSLTG
jgi:class 3 adenylate cyclase/predicted ATPase